MAKLTLNWYVEGINGKVSDCKKPMRGHCVRTNPYTGEPITQNIGIRNLTTHPYSSTELQRQAKFRATIAAVQQVMSDPDQLSSYVSAFRQQKRYRTLRGFIFAQKYATITV